MRKNYFEILKEAKVNPVFELNKIQNLLKEIFYENGYRCSVYALFSKNFKLYKNRRHILSLDELVSNIEKIPMTTEDRLFCFFEMYLDLLSTLPKRQSINLTRQVRCIEEQIKCTTNLLGHKVVSIDNKMIIIEDNVFANEAVQVVTEFNDVKEALSILEYNHFSNKGNVDRKKEILIKIASLLEPWRNDLNNNIEFKDVLKLGNNNKVLAVEKLFRMFNKLNIRHNNDGQQLTHMDNNTVEVWYDKIYTMSLFVILGKDVAQILADFNEFVD